MDLSRLSAVWIHLGPAPVMCLSVSPVTDCQQVVCYLAGVSRWRSQYISASALAVLHNHHSSKLSGLPVECALPGLDVQRLYACVQLADG
jgi:hypothetical protein